MELWDALKLSHDSLISKKILLIQKPYCSQDRVTSRILLPTSKFLKFSFHSMRGECDVKNAKFDYVIRKWQYGIFFFKKLQGKKYMLDMVT